MADPLNESQARYKSVPLYTSLTVNPYAARHILVSDGTDEAAPRRLLDLLQSHPHVTSLSIAQGTVRDLEQLQSALDTALQSETIGTQLYLFGEESLIWKLHALAIARGLSNEEISLDCSRSIELQSVYCVHCSNLQTHPVQGVVRCLHCQVVLEVRAHFSRRLAAYLGVCQDENKPYGEFAA